MLPQNLITLIQNSSQVTVVNDNAKCSIRDWAIFSGQRRSQSHDRNGSSSPPLLDGKSFPSGGMIMPLRGNFRWDSEVKINDEEPNPGTARKGDVPEDFTATEDKKKSCMGLSLPVRRTSTDSLDAAILAAIFDDMSLLDDSDEDEDDEEYLEEETSGIPTRTNPTERSRPVISLS
mmetsp:Transcript_20364/g.26260  ORF Transcript_20364/g.26260 Transcript_20364/m.26260 type:complete len:176 (+) Transcript_20364:125-652(+)|eukprot:CAMPEP_0198147118 /NCGR_PEP_ID=MMETSP1443-20131203/33293_1 /TAXON_ID=186043 /ORGANISM="Entomoneis sp., Strain CCMP2396" /LENGTH=175 /DNA_ID=CAMNT_0043811283 /DNA_START=97 /DNA_END=624 /DNA_ORIENTATION=-